MTTPVPPGPTPDQPGAVRPAGPTAAPGIPHQAPPPWGPPPGSWTPPPAPPGAWSGVMVPLAPNGLPLAGFGPRLGAYVIDMLVYLAVYFVIGIPVMLIGFTSLVSLTPTAGPNGELPPGEALAMMGSMFAIIGVILLAMTLFTYLYYVEYQLRAGGRTLGKRVLKLQVVPVDPTQPLTRGDLAKRWGVQHVAAMIVPFLNYLDGLWQLWDKPLQQCLHDKAARTVVVKVG